MGNGVATDGSTAVLNAAVKEDAKIRTLRILRGSRSSKTRLRSNGSRRLGRWLSPKACKKEGASERCIEQTSDFAAFYRLAGLVAQLCKIGTQLRYATRISDGAEVVVKICIKGVDDTSAFATSDDELEWRETMLRVLNLPEHPGIATTYAVLEDSRAYYVVMERVAGLDLFEVLRRERLSVEDVRAVLQQLLGALAVLHSSGFIHKDLKLENVMLERRRRRDGQAIHIKLIDFDTLTPWSSAVSVVRDVLGSDQYIAPEAYSGWYSPASDMFAVGVLAYNLLTGQYPFDATLFDDKPGENVVGNPKMEAIRDRLCKASISWSTDAFRLDPAARCLWERALAIDAKLRPAALEALTDPWFTTTRSAAVSLSPPTSGKLDLKGASGGLLRTTESPEIWLVPAPPEDTVTFLTKATCSVREPNESPPRLGFLNEDISDIPLPPGCIDTD